MSCISTQRHAFADSRHDILNPLFSSWTAFRPDMTRPAKAPNHQRQTLVTAGHCNSASKQ